MTKGEIKALEHLASLSGNDWFTIKANNYIWDNDNKVRLSTHKAILELIECSIDFIKKLTFDEIQDLRSLYEKIISNVDFDFDGI